MDSFKDTGDMLFASFDIYDNAHVDLMKEIATYARKSLDVSTPVNQHGLRYSSVTQKAEWMRRTADTMNINLPIFPGSVEDLLKCSESSNFCFLQAMVRRIYQQ